MFGTNGRSFVLRSFANMLAVFPAAGTSPMIGMEIIPSGRMTADRERSWFRQTVISSTSSGPSRNSWGASYASSRIASEEQPDRFTPSSNTHKPNILIGRNSWWLSPLGSPWMLLTRKHHHRFAGDDDRVAGEQADILCDNAAQDDFVVARFQDLLAVAVLADTKHDDLVSRGLRRKASRDRNGLQQRRLAFQ